MSFASIATPFINLGISVFPLKPGMKEPIAGLPFLTAATTDPITIENWSKENPDCNVALLADDDHCYLEFDITKGLEDAAKMMGGQAIPLTRMQQSGGGFVHCVFKHNSRSRTIGNRSVNLANCCTCDKQKNVCLEEKCNSSVPHHHHEWFSFRARNKYLVGAGSLHPNGNYYKTTLDVAPIEVPSWVLDFVEQKTVAPRVINVKDMIEVCDDFDFDNFCDFFDISTLGEKDGVWQIVQECPGVDYRHENSRFTGFYWDGSHLGWSCFAQGCPTCGIGIGGLLKFLNEKNGEPYTGPIWTSEEDYAEQEEDLLDGVELDEVEEPEANVPSGHVTAKQLIEILGDAEDVTDTYKAAKPEPIIYDKLPANPFAPVPMVTAEEAEASHEAHLKQVVKDDERTLKALVAEQEEQQFGSEEKPKPILKVSVTRDKEDGGKMSLVTCLASEVKITKLNWLWEGKLPSGKIILFTGKPGGGKSTACADILARVTTGRDWPDGKKNTMGAKEVIIAASEDDPSDTLVPRFIAAGADLSKIHIIDMVVEQGKEKKNKEGVSKRTTRRATLDLKNHCKMLLDLVQKRPEITLLVLDPITSFFGQADQNKDKEIRPLMDEVARICRKSGITVIGLIHGNKRSDVDSLQKILGASSIVGSARAVWGFTIDPEDKDKRFMALVKGNLTKDTKGMAYSLGSAMVMMPDGEQVSIGKTIWGDEVDMDADDILNAERAKARENKEGGKIDLAAIIINSMVPCRQRDIMARAEREGISEKSIYRAKDRLMVKPTKEKDGWWWYLPGAKSKPFKEEPHVEPEDLTVLD
jgi:putative DNA primase/helicase